jgi:two-component system, OmpR family, phosphate regulon sensor histidine kinase PhoR
LNQVFLVSWLRSRLFWKITGLYALLSAIALIGLLLTLGSQLEKQSLSRQQTALQEWTSAIRDELESGATPSELIAGWKPRLALTGTTLWLLDGQLNSLISEEDGPAREITIQSVVQRTLKEGQSAVRIRLGTDKLEYLALGQTVAIPDSQSPAILLALTQPAAVREQVAPIHSAAQRTAIFTWLIGIVCMAFVTAGIVGPLQSMSLNLQSIDPNQREDMLLTISDRRDELGQVANSLQNLEEERQEQMSRLQSTERMARSSSDLLTTVLDSMIEGVIAIDREQRIVFLNSGARTLLAVSNAIGTGHRLYEAVRVPAFLETVAEAISSQTMQTLEYRASREQTDLVLVVIPILKGPHAGAVVVVRDVSEMRRLEAMRRDFVSGVSHELKTPLTVIQACTDTLLGGALADPPAAERFLKQIEEQSERLLQLILGMLQLARVESGQQILNIKSCDAIAVVEDIVRSFRTVADSLSVRLIHTGSAEMVLNTDPQALRTILSNLVDNALKHTDAGGSVIVDVQAESSNPAIVVRDTGTGIPEELLGRIFERFYRVERDRSRERGGSGLGLAIVKHLCQAIAASITVKSEVGRGSEFCVRFATGQGESPFQTASKMQGTRRNDNS